MQKLIKKYTMKQLFEQMWENATQEQRSQCFTKSRNLRSEYRNAINNARFTDEKQSIRTENYQDFVFIITVCELMGIKHSGTAYCLIQFIYESDYQKLKRLKY